MFIEQLRRKCGERLKKKNEHQATGRVTDARRDTIFQVVCVDLGSGCRP